MVSYRLKSLLLFIPLFFSFFPLQFIWANNLMVLDSLTLPITDKQLQEDGFEQYRIYTGHGPEDFELDNTHPSTPRLIISCTKRYKGKEKEGGIWYYHLQNKERQANTFLIRNYNTAQFHPHGISLATVEGTPMLYVISHEAKEDKILQFELRNTELYCVDSLSSFDFPIIKGANDLFVNNEGDIYFSNHDNFFNHVILHKKSGYIGYISHDRKINKQLVNKIDFPNGLYIRDNKLFVSTTSGNSLLEYQMKSNQEVNQSSKVKKADIKGGDNILVDGNQMFIAHHPSFFKFFLHTLFAAKSTSQVTLYDMETAESKVLLKSKGKLISASSTALVHGGFLYVSQVFNNYIVRIPLPE